MASPPSQVILGKYEIMPSSFYHSHLICKFYFLSSLSSNTQTRSLSHLNAPCWQLTNWVFISLISTFSQVNSMIAAMFYYLRDKVLQGPLNYTFTDSSLAALLHVPYSPASLNFLTSFSVQLYCHPVPLWCQMAFPTGPYSFTLHLPVSTCPYFQGWDSWPSP